MILSRTYTVTIYHGMYSRTYESISRLLSPPSLEGTSQWRPSGLTLLLTSKSSRRRMTIYVLLVAPNQKIVWRAIGGRH